MSDRFRVALGLAVFWAAVVGYVGRHNGFLPGQDRAQSEACKAPKPGMVGCAPARN